LSVQKALDWWELGVYGALCCAIFLLGVGRLELPFSDRTMSAWSVSRTALGFWLILKLTVQIRQGWPSIERNALLQFAPLLVFFAVVSLSLIPDFRSTGDLRYLAFAVAHAVMVADIFSHSERQRWLLRLMALAPLIVVLRGFIHAPEIFDFALAHRFGYPLDHPNSAGYLLAMSFPLGLAVAIIESGWWRWSALLSCTGQLLALLLTYSRGAWLGWIGAMIFFGIATKQWRYLLVTLVLAAACVAGLPALRERLVSVIRPRSDASISERLEVLRDTLRLGMDHPILGVGYGRGRLKAGLRANYQDTYGETRPIWHAHNVYGELFAETGLLGLGTFLWMILYTLYRLLRAAIRRSSLHRQVGYTIAASWIAAALAGLGDIPFYHHEPRVFFFSLFALAYLYCREPQTEPSGR
jgi:O-antigen ligase